MLNTFQSYLVIGVTDDDRQLVAAADVLLCAVGRGQHVVRGDEGAAAKRPRLTLERQPDLVRVRVRLRDESAHYPFGVGVGIGIFQGLTRNRAQVTAGAFYGTCKGCSCG